MKLRIAGRDESATLGRQIEAAAAQRPDPAGLGPLLDREAPVLTDGWRGDAATFADRHIALMQVRQAVDTGEFAASTRAGMLGVAMGWVRRFLWKLLRYQHDWVTFRQSAINEQLLHALVLERQARADRDRDLERRLAALEAKAAGGGSGAATPAEGRRP
jgi:hypothetical protein